MRCLNDKYTCHHMTCRQKVDNFVLDTWHNATQSMLLTYPQQGEKEGLVVILWYKMMTSRNPGITDTAKKIQF